MYFFKENYYILIQISMTFVFRGPTEKSALIWYTESLTEPILTQFDDANIRYTKRPQFVNIRHQS